jgi:hypothetical protein
MTDGQVVRVEAPGGRVLWTGRVDFSWDPAQPNGLAVSGSTPLSLLEGMPLPFAVPGRDVAGDPAAFDHWWRQLWYVFDVEDPLAIAPLPVGLGPDDKANAERFVEVSRRLAASALLSSTVGVTVHQQRPNGDPIPTVDFPPFDLQAGFAVTLRQCDDPGESASFSKVKNALALACKTATDTRATERRATVEHWGDAVKRLHARSAEQLVRDRFVEEEGWRGFDFKETHSPRQLVQMFNYGELIHWSAKTDVRSDTPEFLALWQQYEFFAAAAGLAHVYVGFGELVATLIGW